MVKKILAFFLFTASMLSFANHDPIDANARYQALTTELRCLVCQNENLADSDAPLAKDLRLRIKNKIASGETDDEIIRDLTDRYGEFILFRPSMSQKNIFLWAGPFLLLILGFLIVMLAIFLHRRKFNQVKSLTKEEKQKLEQSLK